MKELLKKIDVAVAGGKNIQVTEKLSTEFESIIGIFAIEKSEYKEQVSANETKISDITFGLRVSGDEVIPNHTDLSLMEFNGKYSWREAMYDLSKENLSARGTQVEIYVNNNNIIDKRPFNFTIYLLLSK